MAHPKAELMKTLTLTLAFLTALPVLGGENDKKKKADAPKVENQQSAKKAPGDKRKAPQENAEANAKGMNTLEKAELERLLKRYQAERKEAVAKVNQSHDATEAMQKEIKAKTDQLNKLQAELTKTASAVEHLKKKAAAVEKAHEAGHAKEEMLNKKIDELEAELERREQIANLEKQASELSRKAEALRKKAAELKKK